MEGEGGRLVAQQGGALARSSAVLFVVDGCLDAVGSLLLLVRRVEDIVLRNEDHVEAEGDEGDAAVRARRGTQTSVCPPAYSQHRRASYSQFPRIARHATPIPLNPHRINAQLRRTQNSPRSIQRNAMHVKPYRAPSSGVERYLRDPFRESNVKLDTGQEVDKVQGAEREEVR